LVKILKLDDRLYANNLFYPRDLTGHKLLRTWEDSEQGDMDRKEYNSYSCEGLAEFRKPAELTAT
jgi:hypothetical protein